MDEPKAVTFKNIKTVDSSTVKLISPTPKSTNLIFGKKWYYKLVHDDSSRNRRALLDDYKFEELHGHLLIRYDRVQSSYVTPLYHLFDSYIEFLEFEESIKPPKSFYEIINFQQKPKFDIDINYTDEIKDEFDEIGPKLVETIIKCCKLIIGSLNLKIPEDILLYSSHGTNKKSYHIVLNHWYHVDHYDALAFYEKISHLVAMQLGGRYIEYIDGSVYKKNQAWRLLGSQKHDSERIKKQEFEMVYVDNLLKLPSYESTKFGLAKQFADSLITFTGHCKALPSYRETPIYSKLFPSVTLTEMDVKEIEEMLYKEFKNLFTLRSVKGNIIYLTRKHPYYCRICNRKHEHENPRIMIIDGCVKWHCQRSDTKCILGYLTSSINIDVKTDKSEECDESEEDDHILCIGGKEIKLKEDYKLNLLENYQEDYKVAKPIKFSQDIIDSIPW